MQYIVGVTHQFILIRNYCQTFIINIVYIQLIAIMFQRMEALFYYYKIIRFLVIIIRDSKINLKNFKIS
jgi:hypothetical protein